MGRDVKLLEKRLFSIRSWIFIINKPLIFIKRKVQQIGLTQKRGDLFFIVNTFNNNQ